MLAAKVKDLYNFETEGADMCRECDVWKMFYPDTKNPQLCSQRKTAWDVTMLASHFASVEDLLAKINDSEIVSKASSNLGN